MLEKINLKVSVPKQEYKQRRKILTKRLTLLQRACWEHKIPIMILFEGWDASGKGTNINLLASYMDPRGFKIQPIKGASDYEKQMPWLWRFWQRIPARGEIAIFDRSWYGRVLVERVEKITPPEQWRQAYQEILEFERALSEDGYMLIKFFLHISKKEQKARFKKLEKDPLQEWRIQKEDWEHHKKYDKYLEATEEMLARTETEWGGWTIVEATDRRWARLKIFETLCRRMEEALTSRGFPVPEYMDEEPPVVAAQEDTESAGQDNGKEPAGDEQQEVAHA